MGGGSSVVEFAFAKLDILARIQNTIAITNVWIVDCISMHKAFDLA